MTNYRNFYLVGLFFSQNWHRFVHSSLFFFHPDTLIKDIPYSLQLQIVKLMDPSDANHHDWRGIASVMNLSADDVRQLENAQDHGKMKGLIDKMIQLKKNVNDLLGWLRNPNVARWDVIDEIKNFSFNIPLKFLSPETESSEDQSSGVFLGLLFKINSCLI